METTCKDSIFGTMAYKRRWCKQQKISLFGQVWEITVAARSFSGKPITDQQRNSYKRFIQEEKNLLDAVGDQLKQYVNVHLTDLASNWPGARTVSDVKDLATMVTPRTLLFKQDGTMVLLLDCVWDEEIGIAVKLLPDVLVGPQDLFI